MAIIDILNEINENQIRGINLHRDLISYFQFLGYCEFTKIQEQQFYSESKENIEFRNFCLNKTNKLLNPINPEPENLFLEKGMLNIDRFELETDKIDVLTKNGIDIWLLWEKGTIKFYENRYKQILDFNEVEIANIVSDMIKEVGTEIKFITDLSLNLKNVYYNVHDVLSMQGYFYNQYLEMFNKKGRKKHDFN